MPTCGVGMQRGRQAPRAEVALPTSLLLPPLLKKLYIYLFIITPLPTLPWLSLAATQAPFEILFLDQNTKREGSFDLPCTSQLMPLPQTCPPPDPPAKGLRTFTSLLLILCLGV